MIQKDEEKSEPIIIDKNNNIYEKIKEYKEKYEDKKEEIIELKLRNENLNKTNEGLAFQIKKYKLEIKNLQNL